MFQKEDSDRPAVFALSKTATSDGGRLTKQLLSCGKQTISAWLAGLFGRAIGLFVTASATLPSYLFTKTELRTCESHESWFNGLTIKSRGLLTKAGRRVRGPCMSGCQSWFTLPADARRQVSGRCGI